LVNYDFDEDNGIIRDKSTGERCFIVYKTGAESIFQSLIQIFNSGIEFLLLEASRASGKHIADSTEKEAKIDIKLLLSGYLKRFAQAGFGRIEVCELEPEKGRMRFRVWNNLFAEMRYKESTYCCYVGGLFSGLYEGVFHRVPTVREVKCIGNGDPYCEFLLTPKVP
jgi:predicted hydrocarbon binding protein